MISRKKISAETELIFKKNIHEIKQFLPGRHKQKNPSSLALFLQDPPLEHGFGWQTLVFWISQVWPPLSGGQRHLKLSPSWKHWPPSWQGLGMQGFFWIWQRSPAYSGWHWHVIFWSKTGLLKMVSPEKKKNSWIQNIDKLRVGKYIES